MISLLKEWSFYRRATSTTGDFCKDTNSAERDIQSWHARKETYMRKDSEVTRDIYDTVQRAQDDSVFKLTIAEKKKRRDF